MSTDDTIRVPANLEAERAVLGGCLIAPDKFVDARAILQAEDFHRIAHRRIWEAMCALNDARTPLDIVLVSDALSGHLESVGGMAYVASLTDGLGQSTNVAHYADVVRSDSALRQLQTAASTAIRDAGAQRETPDAIKQALVDSLDVIERASAVDNWATTDEMMAEAANLIDRIQASGGAPTGVRTGLLELDTMTRGLQPGQLVLLAARPAVGKSALALLVAMTVAAAHPVAFFSMEMSKSELSLRMLAVQGKTHLHHMSSGQLREHDYAEIGAMMNDVSRLNMVVNDTPGQTVAGIRAEALRLHKKQALGLVVIDYLQLIESPGRSQDNRTTQVGAISRGLKKLARELNVPVLALSQLNRQVEGRADKKPVISDLRESGSLEQDADMVWLLHRPDAVSEENVQECELIVGKQRQGPTGTVHLVYFRQQTRFASKTFGHQDDDHHARM